MKLDNLRQLIKEELTKALNKYDEGTTIVWKGFRVIVDQDNGETTLTVKPASNPEAKPKTVFRKDTYPVQKVNEDTFHNGTQVEYDDRIYTVKKDHGNVGVEIVGGGDNKSKLINRTQLKRVVKEVDIYKANYINGIKSIIKKYPELNLQSIVDKALEEKGVSSMEELTNKQAMELNIQIQDAIPSKEIPPFKSTPSERDLKPSRGYMGAKYTGD